MATKTTFASLSKTITTEAEAYSFLESLRWGDVPTCGHCDSSNVYLIGCANGVSRRTRTGAMSERRVWKCRACKRQFSVLTNTILHGTKIPVRTWVLIYFEMAASKNGVAAREIERKYGFCPRTAWFVLHRLREAMANNESFLSMTGIIIADETWIGGDPKNRHAVTTTPEPVRLAPGETRPNQRTDKTPVVSLVNEKTGEVRSRVVTNVDSKTIGKFMSEHVNMSASYLYTDEGNWYTTLGEQFITHRTVNHSQGEYSRHGASTNRAEGFFSQLKRSLDGTHHAVSVKHLHRYVGEFDFRYTTCEMKDVDRMTEMVKRSQTRLTYRGLKA